MIIKKQKFSINSDEFKETIKGMQLSVKETELIKGGTACRWIECKTCTVCTGCIGLCVTCTFDYNT